MKFESATFLKGSVDVRFADGHIESYGRATTQYKGIQDLVRRENPQLWGESYVLPFGRIKNIESPYRNDP